MNLNYLGVIFIGLIEITWRCKDCSQAQPEPEQQPDPEPEQQPDPEPEQQPDPEPDLDLDGPDFDGPSFVEPEPMDFEEAAPNLDASVEEPSLPDEPLPAEHEEDQEVTYEVIPTGSERGKPLLVDSDG